MSQIEIKIDEYGSKLHYLNGKLHREDGPAVELAGGAKFYYLHGKLHREDGPAVELPDGDKEWWVNSEQVSEEEFSKLKKAESRFLLGTSIALCSTTIIAIIGLYFK